MLNQTKQSTNISIGKECMEPLEPQSSLFGAFERLDETTNRLYDLKCFANRIKQTFDSPYEVEGSQTQNFQVEKAYFLKLEKTNFPDLINNVCETQNELINSIGSILEHLSLKIK